MDSNNKLLDNISTGDPGEGLEEHQTNDSLVMALEENIKIVYEKEKSFGEFPLFNTNFGYKPQKTQLGNYVLGKKRLGTFSNS